MRSLVLAKLGMSFLCKSLALGENVQKKNGERKRFSESRGMYVCFARAFRRVPFCFLLDEESEGVDRAGRLFTYSAVDSDIHPIKLWAKSSNVC